MCISFFFFFVQCCCHLLLNAIMLKLSFHISLQKFCSLQLTFLVMTRCKIFLRKISVSMDCFLLIHVLYKGELRKERAKQFCSYIIMNYIAFFFFFFWHSGKCLDIRSDPWGEKKNLSRVVACAILAVGNCCNSLFLRREIVFYRYLGKKMDVNQLSLPRLNFILYCLFQ